MSIVILKLVFYKAGIISKTYFSYLSILLCFTSPYIEYVYIVKRWGLKLFSQLRSKINFEPQLLMRSSENNADESYQKLPNVFFFTTYADLCYLTSFTILLCYLCQLCNVSDMGWKKKLQWKPCDRNHLNISHERDLLNLSICAREPVLSWLSGCTWKGWSVSGRVSSSSCWL